MPEAVDSAAPSDRIRGRTDRATGFWLAQFLAALLFEVRPSDFWSLALPLVCLLAAAVLAAAPPALRAARVDPMVALRCE